MKVQLHVKKKNLEKCNLCICTYIIHTYIYIRYYFIVILFLIYIYLFGKQNETVYFFFNFRTTHDENGIYNRK